MSREAYVTRSRDGWATQARGALEQLRSKGATEESTLWEMDEIDHEAFCLLIEAMYALDAVSVTEELLVRAQMRPVREGF